MLNLLFVPDKGYNSEVAIDSIVSWSKVRGLKDWKVTFIIPHEDVEVNVQARTNFRNAFVYNQPDIDKELLIPRVVDSVLKEPNNFAIVANYWSIVLTDILEYFAWASERLRSRKGCIGISSFQFEDSGDLEDLEYQQKLIPFVWGTWSDRWNNYLGPRWNINSEYPASSGICDGGINKILKKTGNVALVPKASRSFPIYDIGPRASLDTPKQDYLIIKKPKLEDW